MVGMRIAETTGRFCCRRLGCEMQKIFIFGRGQYFKEKYVTFKTKYEICGFVDNAVESQEEDNFLHIPVYNPSKLRELPQYDIYCVAADFISMWLQLKSLGISEHRIKFGAMIEPLQAGIEKEAFSNGERIFAKNGKLSYSSSKYENVNISSVEDIKKIIRESVKNKNQDIAKIQVLSTNPVSKTFGSERGKAVDRYYIEKFLSSNSNVIHGTVLEVANNQYTKEFGGNNVEKSIVSHVKGWGKNSILCNFETGEGVIENSVDCLICTQTLQYIFDLHSAIKNIYKMLKSGGTALITVPGIKPLCEYDNDNWGEYWSFTPKSIEKLCSVVCNKESFKVVQFGNVKTVTAYLYGLCVEDMKEEDFAEQDLQYPFIICAKISKE